MTSVYAKAPFDHPKADIILRSSDNVDFRVFKLFLSLASPFFEALFSIPQPTEEASGQDTKDGLAVIPVTEDSKTLDTLLCFCYPCTMVEDPVLENLKEVVAVLEAARKYSLEVIEKKACQAIANPRILKAEPLRCFCIARRGGLHEETLLAAKHTLTQPLIPSRIPDIELITATDLLSLLTYHHRCGEAVYALRLDISWIRSHYGSSQACSWLSGGCSIKSCPTPHTGRYKIFSDQVYLQWWENFMEEVFEALRDKPCRSTVQAFAEKTVRAVKKKGCGNCTPKITDGMRDFVDLFSRMIDEKVSQINLELAF